MATRAAALAVLAGSACLAAAGCAGPASTGAGAGAAPAGPHWPGLVGSECAMLPSHGVGSPADLGGRKTLEAAASEPQLSVFVGEIRGAGLGSAVDGQRGLTLFVPANSAFAALSAADLARLRSRSVLSGIVKRHIVSGQVTPAQLGRGASVAAMSGATLTLSKDGAGYKVDGATVLCGNIRTANGTMYIIDKVLLP